MDPIYHRLHQKFFEEYNNLINFKCIKEAENTALTNYEIDKFLGGETKILTYKALSRFNDINKLLEPYKNFIMLYMSKPNYGHWVCVIKHPDRIEFFDPYGGNNEPDQELNLINDNIKKITNQDYPYLTKLLYESDYPIEYNNYKFQEHHRDIKTCGRHCIVRVMFKDLLLDEYHRFLLALHKKTKLSYDEIVTSLTQ